MLLLIGVLITLGLIVFIFGIFAFAAIIPDEGMNLKIGIYVIVFIFMSMLLFANMATYKETSNILSDKIETLEGINLYHGLINENGNVTVSIDEYGSIYFQEKDLDVSSIGLDYTLISKETNSEATNFEPGIYTAKTTILGKVWLFGQKEVRMSTKTFVVIVDNIEQLKVTDCVKADIVNNTLNKQILAVVITSITIGVISGIISVISAFFYNEDDKSPSHDRDISLLGLILLGLFIITVVMVVILTV